MDAVISGLVLGGLFTLVGQSIVLTFVTTRTINFASGEFIAVAAFIGLGLGSWTWLPGPSKVVVAVLAVGVLGALTYRFLVVPFSHGEHDTRWLLSTVGLSYILVNLLTNAYGANPRRLGFARITEPTTLLGANINPQALLITGLAIVVTLALVAGSKWTSGGLLMRAVAEDAETASLMGVSPRRVGAFAYAGASALAGLAGLLWAAEVGVSSHIGLPILVSAFAVAVIGGLTSFWGPLVGGAIYAVVVQIAAYEIGSLWGSIIGLFLVIAVLVVRPEGLMGRRMEAKL